MKTKRFITILAAALMSTTLVAEAQWPGDRDFGGNNPDPALGNDGNNAAVVPLLTVPFGRPFLSGPRDTPLFAQPNAGPPGGDSSTPAQYDQCLQFQSANPVRDIKCGQ
jgi:hypothetical protein